MVHHVLPGMVVPLPLILGRSLDLLRATGRAPVRHDVMLPYGLLR